MKIVIDIPEEIYEQVKDRTEDSNDEWITMRAVANGTTLPEGHGRLIDADALYKEVASWGMNDYEPSDFLDEIDRAPTIIDKEGKE